MGKDGHNVIPRNYNRITAQILISTSKHVPGDVVHVFRNDYGHLALNMRTNEYAYVSPSMLRDPACCKFTEII